MGKKEKKSTDFTEDGKFAPGNQAHTLRENPGRKSKISRFIQEFACVIAEEHPVGKAIIFTDKELVFLTNQRLEEDERISESTLNKWKNGFEFSDKKDQEEAREFRRLYREGLLKQREHLFEMMMAKSEARSWNRYLAVIERKFDDWNLRKKSVDETPDLKKLVFTVADSGDSD